MNTMEIKILTFKQLIEMINAEVYNDNTDSATYEACVAEMHNRK